LKDDAGHFVYQAVDGDATLLARVADISQLPDNTSEGLFMRESLDSESRGVGTSLSLRKGILWQVRTASGESWSIQNHPEFTTPRWLKLARAGDKFTASCSTTGQDWSEIVSRQATINSNVLAGLYIRSGNNGVAQWSGLQLSGTVVATPPANTLPPDWESADIGKWSIPGKMVWADAGITMKSPAVLNSSDNGQPLGGYAFVPMTGDDAIMARLEDLTPAGNESTMAGLCFRNDKSDDAPEIHFVLTATGEATFSYKIDAQAESVRYFKHVAELDPKNTALLINVAEQLRHANKSDAAADLYAVVLKNDFPTGMNQGSNVEQAFEQSNRLPEFVKIIQDWTPQPINPMFGGGPDIYFTLLQLSTQMKRSNHMPEAEQLLRKALSVPTMQSKQDGTAALAQLLLEEGRRDDAAAEIEKWMEDKTTAVVPPPILGFNVQVQNQSNWFQTMSWNSNGVVSSPVTHFLELADAVGLTGKLKQTLQAKVDKNAAPPAGQIDSNQMTIILLEIISRDPAYRAQLEKVLKAAPITPGGSVNTNAYIILSQELGKWPEERATALKLSRQLYDASSGTQGNSMVQNVTVRQMLKLAEATGDHKTAQEILRKRIQSVREMRAINPNQVPIDQVLVLSRQLIQEGMFKEATDLLADAAKNDPQLQAQPANSYWKVGLGVVENQLAFAKGENVPDVSLVYGVAPAPAKADGKGTSLKIYWQIDGEGPQNRQRYFSSTAWREGAPARHTTFFIRIKGGADQASETDLVTLKNVETPGSTIVKIPPGTRVLTAELGVVKPAANGSSASASAPTPAPTPTWIGNDVLLAGGENLLKNPDFQVSKNAAGQSVIDGWKYILPASVTREKGGPLPAGGYETVEATTGIFGGGSEITSDRIPIQPHSDYVFGGWLRLSGNVSLRYLDSTGAMVKSGQVMYGANDTDWQWRSWLLKGNPDEKQEGEVIPPSAAFVQVVMTLGQDSDFAGLSLRTWPATAGK